MHPHIDTGKPDGHREDAEPDPAPEGRDFARTYARGVLTDEQYSAVQWLAISMNATLENPLVAERNKDGRGAYEIFADSSGTPTPRTRLSGCAF